MLDQFAADRQVGIVAPEDAHALGDRRPILVIAALAAGAAQDRTITIRRLGEDEAARQAAAMRVAGDAAPTGEALGALVITLAAAAVLIVLGARVHRAGITRTGGTRLRLREALMAPARRARPAPSR